MTIEEIDALLVRANSLREAEEYTESIKLYSDVLVEIINQNFFPQLVHTVGGLCLTYRLLFRKHKSLLFINIASVYGRQLEEICASHTELDGRVRSIALSTFADVLIETKSFAAARDLYQQSLDATTANVQEKGRLKVHLGSLTYLSGNKPKGLSLVEEGLSDIRSLPVDHYAAFVWETGALNTKAKLLSLEGDITNALKFADESLQIAKNNKLTIREREIVELIEKIKSNKLDFYTV